VVAELAEPDGQRTVELLEVDDLLGVVLVLDVVLEADDLALLDLGVDLQVELLDDGPSGNLDPPVRELDRRRRRLGMRDLEDIALAAGLQAAGQPDRLLVPVLPQSEMISR